ncbi:MAG: thioether cross-link-forming SCIFF peptide maturase [Ruminococcaceae bacterium]|nr:thioether cross-link-forming SCIFF peptide maturase [Oscillospiraceae bacterium]
MVHSYEINGTKIVLDSESGAVSLIDDITFALLKALGDSVPETETLPQELADKLPQFSKDELQEVWEELLELKKEEVLFAEDPYEAISKKPFVGSVVKAMCLHIAHDCNLRCRYCFAETGSYDGPRGLMSAEVGKNAIDYLINASGHRKNLEVDFFGGEPLLNFEVVKEIVRYAREREKDCGKNFRFTITTNGLLLDDAKKEFINAEMVNIVLSIDGRKEVNDYMRYRVDGTGSYDTIVPRFMDMAESRNQDNYYVRGTFTRKNLDFKEDVLHLADLGFKQISVEPVVSSPDKDYMIQEEDLPVLYEQYESLAAEYVKRKKEGNGFNFFHFMVDLTGGPCILKRLSGCGAGHEYVAVAPNGDIYPCHQFVGDESKKMGNVKEPGLDESISQFFRESNIYTKPACKNCFAKFYCSGGCPANAVQYGGGINNPLPLSCALMRKRLECAIYCTVMQQEAENE